MNARKTLGMCLTALLLATVASEDAQGATAEPIRPLPMDFGDQHCDPVYWYNNQPQVDPDCIEPPLT
jgi:hypothetical protein